VFDEISLIDDSLHNFGFLVFIIFTDCPLTLETVIDDAHKKAALSETAVSRSLRNILLLLGRRDRDCTKSRLKRSARAQGATRQGVSRFAQWRPDALGMASSWWPAHPP